MGVGNIEVLGQNAALADFIKKSLEGRRGSYRRVIIGVVSPEAQKRIDEVCHTQVFNINIDNSGVVHAVTKRQHNLEPGDLLNAVDVINTATDIRLSEKKHKDTDVLVFVKDIGGDITFLAEVHVRGRYLVVFDAWRQKKVRRDTTAQWPSANVQDGPPHTFC